MDLKQLRTFYVVAELGSLSKASDRLGTVQPALSRQIRLLEHDLRAALFVRDGRGMVLTPIGRRLRDRAADLIHQIEQLRKDILSEATTVGGPVVLGMIPSVGQILGGRVSELVLRSQPNISLLFVEAATDVLLERLQRREIDVAILYRSGTEFHFPTEDIAREEYRILGRPDLLPNGPSVSLDWLVGQTLILSTYMSRLLDREAKKHKLTLHMPIIADSLHVVADLVTRGLGVTLLPASAFTEQLKSNTLGVISLSSPRIYRRLMIAFHDGGVAPATEAVARLIRAEAARLAEAGIWTLPIRPASSAQQAAPSRHAQEFVLEPALPTLTTRVVTRRANARQVHPVRR